MPNVLVEIYLLLELLTVKAEDDGDDICGQEDAMDEGIFSTVHNCVFFSTHVLSSQVCPTGSKIIYSRRSFWDSPFTSVRRENNTFFLVLSTLQRDLMQLDYHIIYCTI